MQMFEFLGPSPGNPSRTSNHEALITFHEMGHYITNRLVGNGTGLDNQQGGALGEGGDFFAVCMTSQDGDDFLSGAFQSVDGPTCSRRSTTTTISRSAATPTQRTWTRTR